MNSKVTDAYTWQVTYQDGSSLPEYDSEEGATSRGFAEVRSESVSMLSLLGQGRGYSVHIPEGALPVFFRRRSITLSVTEEGEGARETTHCIGWSRGESGVYLFVHDDGSTLLTDDFQAV